ncbi:MAG TPA: XRE family transcriptional regulator, partial [Blastocatellia bacterium]|nr:XRE family transcriptional regulator [Blastocatellia bacterium]
LNMSQVLIPGGTGVDEHYCRRWLAIRILDQLKVRRTNDRASDEPIVDAQLSRFVESDARYLSIAMARRLTLNPSATSSVSLGFRCDEDFERVVKFAKDKRITRLDIDGTCERCRLTPEECRERAAPPLVLQLQHARDEIESELASL